MNSPELALIRLCDSISRSNYWTSLNMGLIETIDSAKCQPEDLLLTSQMSLSSDLHSDHTLV